MPTTFRVVPAVSLACMLAAVGCGGDDPTSPDPSLHDEAGGWQQVVAGDGASCGLDPSGAAYCWGKNDRGQLGDGTNTPHATPALVHGNLHFSMLAMGSVTACGLANAGQIYCWGYYGIAHYAEPHLVDTQLRFTKLAVGASSICALTADGVAYCWSLIRTDEIPAPLGGSHQFKTLSAASTIFAGGFCGAGTDFAGYCWGEGALLESQVVRQPLRGFVEQIVTDGDHTCAVLVQGVTECWGKNFSGELGDGSTVNRTEPVRVAGDIRFSAVGVASLLTCGVSTRGRAYCWGRLRHFADITDPVLTPTTVLPGLLVDRVSVGADHTCFVTPGGAAYCFGANGAGQLGTGLAGDPVDEPVRVLDPA
jgi:alpha-tubulin suppressor-like RCC1 family protein